MGHVPHVRAATDSYRADMPRFIIQRTLPGAGRLSSEELQAISQKSNEVLDGMAPRAQWVQSFVTDDKIFCHYLADDEAAVREHGRCGGFPVDSVHQVHALIDPMTGAR